MRTVAEEDLPVTLPDMTNLSRTVVPNRRWLKLRDEWLFSDRFGRYEIESRDEQHAAVGRVLLVLPALHRSQKQ